MPRTGKRHLLLVYPLMLNRWWRITLFTGIVLLITAAGLGWLPLRFPDKGFLWVEDWRLWIVAAAGGICILFSIFLILIRNKAHVQAFQDHLRLVTPFLRLNISYRRLRRSYTLEMQQVFPPSQLSPHRREIIRPLARHSAVLLDLVALPVSRATLRFFFSPFFLPDQSARLCLLVPDWLAFSTELDSFFTAWQDARRPASENPFSVFPGGSFSSR